MGAGVGAVAALLLAPKAGEELRGDIAAGVSDGVDQVRAQVRGTGKDLKRSAQKIVTLAQDQVQDAVEAGQEAYDQAKKA